MNGIVNEFRDDSATRIDGNWLLGNILSKEHADGIFLQETKHSRIKRKASGIETMYSLLLLPLQRAVGT